MAEVHFVQAAVDEGVAGLRKVAAALLDNCDTFANDIKALRSEQELLQTDQEIDAMLADYRQFINAIVDRTVQFADAASNAAARAQQLDAALAARMGGRASGA